jgi:predicted porin
MEIMKTIGLPLFVLCSTLYALPAVAQSSVTLYGIIDNSVQYINNSHGKGAQVSLADSNASAERFGFRGVEELGGGMRAVFDLENGFAVNTGALKNSGRLFGRQAFVGIEDDRYGTFTLGRQYDAIKDLLEPYSGVIWLTPGDVDDAYASIRMSNVIKWASPSSAPLRAVVTYSMGGVTGSTGSGQTYSAALGYAAGKLNLAGGYLHINNGNAATSTRGTTTADSLYSSSVNSAYVSASSIDIVRAGGEYDYGQFSLNSYLSVSRYGPDGNSTFKTPEFYRDASIVLGWQFTPALILRGGYERLQSNGSSKADYNQFTVAAFYDLSKRTDVYVMETYERATGNNGLGPAQAVVSDTAITGTSSVVLSILGLRHRF